MKKYITLVALIVMAYVANAQTTTVRVWNNTGYSAVGYAYFCGNSLGNPICANSSITVGMTPLSSSGYIPYTPGSFSTWTIPTPTVFNGIHFSLGMSGGGYDAAATITQLCGRRTGDVVTSTFIISGLPVTINFNLVTPTQIDIELTP